MNAPAQVTPQEFCNRLGDAYTLLDAAMPTVLNTIEHLGNTDVGRTFWLVQKALESAHAELGTLLRDCEVNA